MTDDGVSAPRLCVDASLASGVGVVLDKAQANYVINVLRLKAGDPVLVFNGRDGEWLTALVPDGRKSATLLCSRQIRPQPLPSSLLLLFAPLKHARLDYLVQKATEMGASAIAPVITRRTQVSRVNLERMRANVVEAAEQCGVLCVPEVRAEARLAQALEALPPGQILVFCDEDAPVSDAVSVLAPHKGALLAVIIGPEGGFSPEERAQLLARPGTLRLSLGPRILRADTAAVAALALVQAVCGDAR
jgi:16S rRNA (uracil1498-N3)-methyltransferase